MLVTMLALAILAVLSLVPVVVRHVQRAEGRLSELCRPIDREGQ